MAQSFAITTTAPDPLKADANGHAEAVFTVTNTTSRPIRGLATAKSLGATKRDWLAVRGETERDFAGGATEQFVVNIHVAGVPGGRYPCRLDVASAANPDEDFTTGPVVNVDVAGSVTAAAPKKAFPLWIVFVIVGVLLLVGIVILLLVFRSNNTSKVESENPTPALSSPTAIVPSPTPAPSPTPVLATVNLALNRPATESSVFGPAARAVDGIRDGNWNSGSVTHTNSEANAWWQVDLGAVRSIVSIGIWNRTDCCADRLSNFYVFVSDTPFNSPDVLETVQQAGVFAFQETGQAGSPTTIAVGRTGRYVRIQLAGTNVLSLAEVEVNGH